MLPPPVAVAAAAVEVVNIVMFVTQLVLDLSFSLLSSSADRSGKLRAN
jgi:hypothetical protein